MIIYVVLFILIILVSFILAWRSMKDYQTLPQTFKEEYGLFLIRKPQALTIAFLETIHQYMLTENLIISLERSFRGGQSALTIFGPKKMLRHTGAGLDLMELEDYSGLFNSKDFLAWEVGIKSFDHIFTDFPLLPKEDQFFWQVVMEARKKAGERIFQTQIRAVVFVKDPPVRKNLVSTLQNPATGKLTKLPRPFSNDQLLQFYRLRSLSKDTGGPAVGIGELLSLLRVS